MSDEVTATPPRTNAASPTAAGIDPVVTQYDRPALFYVLATVIPWLCWLAAAFFSHRPEQTPAVQLATAALGVVGLAAPVAVAAWLISRKRALIDDVRKRLAWPRRAGWVFVVAAFALMPGSTLVASAISLLFGYDADQFQLRDGWTFSAGVLPVWFTLVAAAVLEELAWHSYGTDALIRRMRVFSASMLFALIWTLWHLPLSFIKGYYHAEVVAQGWLQTLNFPLSLVAFVLLMNWIYFRSGRSILLAVVVHISANFGNEVFNTHEDTKIIQTALLLVVCAIVVTKDRRLFFRRPRSGVVSAVGVSD